MNVMLPMQSENLMEPLCAEVVCVCATVTTTRVAHRVGRRAALSRAVRLTRVTVAIGATSVDTTRTTARSITAAVDRRRAETDPIRDPRLVNDATLVAAVTAAAEAEIVAEHAAARKACPTHQ
jgi:hypothetical protein